MCKHLVRVKQQEEIIQNLRLALQDHRACIDELLMSRCAPDATPVDVAAQKITRLAQASRVAH